MRVAALCLFFVSACSPVGPWSREELAARDASGASLLHRAAKEGSRRTVAALLEQGAAVMARDNQERTPLHWAAIGGHARACELLLDAGASIDAVSWFELTPLHWAAMRNRLSVMDVLVTRGADLESRDFYGRTPLHVAASDAAVKLLLEGGASLQPLDRFGMTPLHSVRTIGGAQALLNAGADPSIRNLDGLQALDMTIVANDDGPQEVILFPGAARLRVRGESGELAMLLASVTDRPLRGITIVATSDAVAVEVPEVIPVLHGGQATRSRLFVRRLEGVAEGETVMGVSLREGERQRLAFQLTIDTRTAETPEDRGMTEVGTMKVQVVPRGLHWIAYGSAPLVLLAAWAIIRWRKSRS